MKPTYAAAELLIALFRLGGLKRLPGSDGRLARALQAVHTHLPGDLADLGFGVGSVGLRCYELDDLLLRGQEALMLSILPPSYVDYAIDLDEDAARVVMIQNGLSTADGQEIGRRIAEALAPATSQ